MKQTLYRRYLLAVLMVLLAANYMDGLALGLVLQNIKADLVLSDTQLGLLSGIAFALLYAVMGIPIARWADRGNRVTIISLTAVIWSVMVALCGVASSFTQLLLIRVGVGVGEAGCVPPAHSLIADYFTRAERPRAVGTYLLGNSLSMLGGYSLAGWLNELYGWRATFIALGMLGLVPAVLARFVLIEPRCTKRPHLSARHIVISADQPSFKQVCATLWANATFRHLLYTFSVVYFFSYGIAQWQPAFFIRSYGLKTGELGTWFAVIYGVGGFLGTYLGGDLASRYAANNERLQLQVMATAYCVYGLLCTFVYLAPNVYLAFGAMALAVMAGAVTTGPLFAMIQTLVPQRMRALSIAIVYLFANLIGLGLGPVATGAISDALLPRFGNESLRYALLSLCPGFLWVAWHLWRASKTVGPDLAAVDRDQAPA
jgi:MFS transporter, Spinster family, sphingosine-1-phosphate transporter